MIGNDIVDLQLSRIESNWRRKNYIEKIFTAKEQIFIQNSSDSESAVWNLWTRKEAAYKVYVQETKITGYFPFKIECNVENEIDGTVTISDKLYHTQTFSSIDFIYTIAVKNLTDFENISHLDSRNNIIKKDGIPQLYDVNTKKKYAASVTNHGRFQKIATCNIAINVVDI